MGVQQGQMYKLEQISERGYRWAHPSCPLQPSISPAHCIPSDCVSVLVCSLQPAKIYIIVNAMVRLEGIQFNRINMGTRGARGAPVVTRNRGGLETLHEDYHNAIRAAL